MTYFLQLKAKTNNRIRQNIFIVDFFIVVSADDGEAGKSLWDMLSALLETGSLLTALKNNSSEIYDFTIRYLFQLTLWSPNGLKSPL